MGRCKVSKVWVMTGDVLHCVVGAAQERISSFVACNYIPLIYDCLPEIPRRPEQGLPNLKELRLWPKTRRPVPYMMENAEKTFAVLLQGETLELRVSQNAFKASILQMRCLDVHEKLPESKVPHSLVGK